MEGRKRRQLFLSERERDGKARIGLAHKMWSGKLTTGPKILLMNQERVTAKNWVFVQQLLSTALVRPTDTASRHIPTLRESWLYVVLSGGGRGEEDEASLPIRLCAGSAARLHHQQKRARS